MNLPEVVLHGMREEVSSGTIINNITHIFFRMCYDLPRGLVVRIRRSHRRGPGSIPGVGIVLLFGESFFCLLMGLTSHQGSVEMFSSQ